MHCRDITEAQFESIAPELADAKVQGDEVGLITGQHKDHGTVMLIRDGTRCMILVDEPSHFDKAHAGSTASDEAIVERAIQRRQ